MVTASAMKPIADAHDVYEQNESFTFKLTSDSTFLYCECFITGKLISHVYCTSKGARSKDITSISFWKMYDVHQQCKESNFAEKNIPRCMSEWSCYYYFEFTKPEYIKPHQLIIV